MTSPLIPAFALALAATGAIAQEPPEEHAGHGGMEGVMTNLGEWHVMAHGLANAVYDYQGGPRGDTKEFSNSMFMLMGTRPLGSGSLQLRMMLSLDPAMGPAGYPLLLQAGESADGVTHLVDRQHPHDAFMELSGTYAFEPWTDGRAFIYGGFVGEPALGPPAFMHRFSGARIPEAPLTHHWLDSTHITMGVVTLGAEHGPFKLEASSFNGREPDQNRWNIEHGSFDSWSARITVEPAEGLTLQASYGDLKSPEALEPGTRVRRTTASAIWMKSIEGMRWGTTLAWGRNNKSGEDGARKLDGWLAESTLEISPRHTVFGRLEKVRTDELFDHDSPLHGQAFDVGKLSLGYIYDFAVTGPVRWGVGGLVSAFRIPGEIAPYYGSSPNAYMIFLQARL